jgi:16S rRNA (cytosine967-C5)-methyltransferase
VPEWLAELWWSELGAQDARALLRRINEPAESALRVNRLVASPADVLARLPVPAHRAPGLPDGIVLDAPFDVHASELFSQGAIMPQSRGSMLVAYVLAPRPGDRVLDLCAAPGGKTTQLAALMGDEGELVAVERHRGRAEALRRTCRRLHTSCVQVEVGDGTESRTGRLYDRVLVDPPCSGLGTLQSRPDARWRGDPAAIAELASLQARILAVAGASTAPGGTLVYSVCTISRSESEDVVDGFLREHPDFVAEELRAVHPEFGHPEAAGRPGRAGPYLQLLPHRDGTDGFFIARFRRR